MSKIVVCVSGQTLEECLQQVEGRDFAELRLDLIDLSNKEIEMLWSACDEWILTLREGYTHTKNWKTNFQFCLNLNPSYVDIDSELPETIRIESSKWVQDSSSDLIFSYHNFQETPSLKDLNELCRSLFSQGADVVKVACMALAEEDNLIMMDLFSQQKRIIAFCMGEEGRESRVAALFFGEKITYAAPSEKDVVAPGQLSYSELSGLINTGFNND